MLIPALRGVVVGTAILSALIFCYAFLAKSDPELNRREIGDNCYFIGFVYTLLLITISIWNRESDGLNELLNAIAIALATSIVGMFLRFTLTHKLKEPADEMELAARRAAMTVSKLEGIMLQMKESVGEVEKGLARAATAASKYAAKLDDEAKNIGDSLNREAAKLLAEFGQNIADTLQKPLFDGVREELRTVINQHRNAVEQSREMLGESLKKLDESSAVSVANTQKITRTLTDMEKIMGGEKWDAVNHAVDTLATRVKSLTDALKTFADRSAESIADAESDIKRVQEIRKTFDNLMHDMRDDVKAVAKIKEDYRREFDSAAKAALEETHQLYARLILGAEVALAGLDKLPGFSENLRKIAESIESQKDGKK